MIEEKQLVQEVNNFLPFQVVDDQTKEQATDVVLKLKATRKEIEQYWKPIKSNALQVHKTIVEKEKEMLSLVDVKIREFDGEIRKYLRAQEEKRREEERKREEERRKAAEEKRRQEEEARKALDEGDIEKAVEATEKAEAVNIPAPRREVYEKTTKTETGTASQRTEILVEVDPIVFFRYCGEHGLSELWDPKLGAIKAWIKANNITECPGLSIKSDVALSYRGAR